MGGLFNYFFAAFWPHWWPAVTAGGLLGLDSLVRGRWTWGEKQLDRIPPIWRRRIEVFVFVGAVFYAGYAAWGDEHLLRDTADENLNAVSGELTEARRELAAHTPSGQEKTIDVLEQKLTDTQAALADLTNRAGKWDASDRHLIDPEKSAFFESVLSHADQIQNLTIGAVHDPEAGQYATEFMYVLKYAGINVPSAGPGSDLYPQSVDTNSTSQHGLVLMVHDWDSPPDAAKYLETALSTAKLDFIKAYGEWIPSNGVWLIAVQH